MDAFISSMRAVGTTSYSPDAALYAQPTLTLEVQRRSGNALPAYQIVIGAAGADGEDGWYHARRSDLAIL